MKCKHKKLSAVKDDGYQYCLKCNKAFNPPCKHKWVEVDRIQTSNVIGGNCYLLEIIYICEKCGERQVDTY